MHFIYLHKHEIKHRGPGLDPAERDVLWFLCFRAGRWKDYTSLGWPGPEECQRTRRVDLTTVASTWLAVSAKNIE